MCGGVFWKNTICILIVALQESIHVIKLHRATHTQTHTHMNAGFLNGKNKIRSVG